MRSMPTRYSSPIPSKHDGGGPHNQETREIRETRETKETKEDKAQGPSGRDASTRLGSSKQRGSGTGWILSSPANCRGRGHKREPTHAVKLPNHGRQGLESGVAAVRRPGITKPLARGIVVGLVASEPDGTRVTFAKSHQERNRCDQVAERPHSMRAQSHRSRKAIEPIEPSDKRCSSLR